MIGDHALELLRAEFVRRRDATSDVDASNTWADALHLLDMAITPQRHILGAQVAHDALVRPLLERRCPDDGTCHHECTAEGRCWRVGACGPLSGVYPGNEWPRAVIEREGLKPQRGTM